MTFPLSRVWIRRLVVACALVNALGAPPLSAQSARFLLEIENAACGATLHGPPGSLLTVPLRVSIDNPFTNVAGWTACVAVEGLEPEAWGELSCSKSCTTRMIFGDNAEGDEILFLAQTVMEPGYEPNRGPLAGQGPQGPGITQGVILLIETGRSVHLPVGKRQINRLALSLRVPEDPAGVEVVLLFKDGLQLRDSTSIFSNEVYLGRELHKPALEACRFLLRPSRGVLPGDANANGRLELVDVLIFLRQVILGEAPSLPCGDRSYLHPSNTQLGDANGDGRVGIPDAVSLLSHLFVGTAPHVLGRQCVDLADCPASCLP